MAALLEHTQESIELRVSDAALHAQPFRLFDLPPELQDMVLEHAYPEQADLELIDKYTWERSKQETRFEDTQYQVKSFPKGVGSGYVRK
jgi:hypothetical protein